MSAPDLQAVVNVLALLLVIAVLAALHPPECAETCCAHRRSLARADALARQREAQHNAEHKGFGWHDSDPDRYRCNDPECPRNPPRKF